MITHSIHLSANKTVYKENGSNATVFFASAKQTFLM